jgi:hypothetical protein
MEPVNQVGMLEYWLRTVDTPLVLYRHVTKSPNGFDWGYTGAAPSQLAFAILLDHYGAPGPALLFYQDFKESVVALWNADRWELTTAEIESALAKIRILRSRATKELAWKQST